MGLGQHLPWSPDPTHVFNPGARECLLLPMECICRKLGLETTLGPTHLPSDASTSRKSRNSALIPQNGVTSTLILTFPLSVPIDGMHDQLCRIILPASFKQWNCGHSTGMSNSDLHGINDLRSDEGFPDSQAPRAFPLSAEALHVQMFQW